MSKTIISITLSLFGSLFTSTSFIMMKVVHNKTNGKFNPLKEPVWIGGFLSIVIGTLFNMGAMAFGTQVLLSSTSSFSIIFNTVLSSCYLKETLLRSDILAIFLICFGSTMFLVSAKNDETKYDAAQIKAKYTSSTSLVFYVVAGSSMIFCQFTSEVLKKKIANFYFEKTSERTPLKNIIQALQIYKSNSGEFQYYKSILKVPMILSAFTASLMGGIYNSFMRGYLIQIGLENGLVMISTYVYAFICVFGAFLKLYLINKAMTVYDQTEIGPTFSTFFIVFQIFAGAFILDEKSMYNWGEMLLLFLYSSICISGIYIIAKKPSIKFLGGNRPVFQHNRIEIQQYELTETKTSPTCSLNDTEKSSLNQEDEYHEILKNFQEVDQIEIKKVIKTFDQF